MSKAEFDPSTKIEGHNITFGEVKKGGNCCWQMPAVFMNRTVKTGERYAETEEEYEMYGARLPFEITKLVEVEIGCENYQALIAAGVAVDDCVQCPLRQTNLEQ